MSNITNFDDYKLSPEVKRQLTDKFNKLESDFNKLKNNLDYEYFMDDNFKNLYIEFSKIKKKVNDNSRWIPEEEAKKYLLNSKLINDSEKVNLVYENFIHIYLSDITKGKINDNDEELIKNIIIAFAELEIDIIKSIPSLLKVLFHKEILPIIEKNNCDKYFILDIIDLAEIGKNILEIKMIMEDDEEVEDNFESIDSVHEYYMNTATFMSNYLPEEDFDNLERILLIKHKFTSNNIKKFINVAKNFNSKGMNFIGEAKYISILVNLFLKLENEKINKFSEEELENIVGELGTNMLKIEDLINKKNYDSKIVKF